MALCVADDESAAGGLDDVVGEDGQIVDLHDAFDLDEQSVDEAEGAAGEMPSAGRSNW
jgi:hypothetical protein